MRHFVGHFFCLQKAAPPPQSSAKDSDSPSTLSATATKARACFPSLETVLRSTNTNNMSAQDFYNQHGQQGQQQGYGYSNPGQQPYNPQDPYSQGPPQHHQQQVS